MNRGSFFTAALAAALTPALLGQSLTGPTQGIAFDQPSGSLRAVVGSYGSAVLGTTLLSGLTFASAAPQGTRGIACEQDQCFFVEGLGSTAVARAPIADQIDRPDGAAWSADGQVVAIYSRGGAWIRVLRGNGDSSAQQSLSSFGQLVDVEVRPDGKQIALAVTGEQPGIYELQPAGNIVPLLTANHPVDLGYSVDGVTLFVLDGSQISAIGADGIAQSWPLAAVQDGVGVQPGRDASGRDVLYVAGRGDHALFVYDSATHALIDQIALPFAPSQVQPSGTGSFLLTSRGSEEELLWSYTAGRGVFFVPVTPTDAASGLPQRKVRR